MDSRRNTVHADQSMPQWSHNPWRLQNTNRTESGNSASGSGGPGTLPRLDDGIPNSPPFNDWTAQVQALAANPAWAQEQFAQRQLLHINSIRTFNISSSSWRRRRRILGKCFPRTTDPLGTGGVWTRERIGFVFYRPVQQPESVNRQQDGSSNARCNG